MTKLIKIFLIIISLMVFFFQAQAYWVLTDPPPGCVGCDSVTPEGDEALIQGASYLLQSYSDFLLLLNESEMSPLKGFDMQRVETLVKTSLDKLEASHYFYQKSIDVLSSRDFDSGAISRLMGFDYDGFRVMNDLHEETMSRVAYYLSTGDVVGTYEVAHSDIGKILDSLYTVMLDVGAGETPKLSKLQKIYKQYSDLMQFGYYASLVFAEIRK